MVTRANLTQKTFEAPAQMLEAVKELLDERLAQEQEFGADHDDARPLTDWTDIIDRCSVKAEDFALAEDEMSMRHELVQIGALAIAAIETLDRRRDL